MHINNRFIFIVIFGLFLSLFYLHFFENRASVDVEVSVTERTWLKIYWAEEGQAFSEQKRARVRVYPEQSTYRFFLTDIGDITRLRIDPHQYEGRSAIKSITISQNHYKTLVFNDQESFNRLSPVFQVSDYWYDQTIGLITESSGDDPAYFVTIEPEQWGTFSYYTSMMVRIAGIILLLLLFLYRADALLEGTRFIPVVMTVIFFLILVMASISDRNVHPDEYVHFDASAYYINNWLPPVVDSQEISHTFSVYGVSRLNSHEVSYFFTGKFAKLIASFQISDYLRYRLFNVFLFATILLSTYYWQEARLIAIPFIFSPQIWYIFSYCNSDAFALAVTFFFCCQVLRPSSLLHSYLFGNGEKLLRCLLFIGILCGVLLLLKKNYFVFLVFVGGYICWKLYFQIEAEKRLIVIKRLTILVIVAVLFSGLRFGLDYYVNGFDRSAKIAALRVKYADPLYNPNTPLEEKHVFLYRKARGDDWRKLIFYERWFEKTFRSAVGLYGYLTVVASDSYYDAYRWLGSSFLLILIGFVLLRGGPPNWILLFFFLVCAIGMIFISFWHSWTADFQTQGRYLMPIVPMLSILLHHQYKLVPSRVINIGVMVMFFLSCYSFIYVGLAQIPKVVGWL